MTKYPVGSAGRIPSLFRVPFNEAYESACHRIRTDNWYSDRWRDRRRPNEENLKHDPALRGSIRRLGRTLQSQQCTKRTVDPNSAALRADESAQPLDLRPSLLNAPRR